MLSGRLIPALGIPRTLVLGAMVSVFGLAVMPVSGSMGSVVGLVAGSIIHGIGEGSFSPTAVTLRQVSTPPELLGRVNSVSRFLLGGAVPVGSLLAAATISIAGLGSAVWIGGVGTVLCLPVLLRRGIRAGLRGTSA